MKVNNIKRQRNLFTLTISLLCLLWGQICIAQTSMVLGFGDNMQGEIGDGTFGSNNYRPLPTPALQISGVKAVACGVNHTLALDSSGAVWAWGYNGAGELGTGDNVPRYQPVRILTGVKAIAAGDQHSLALKADGTVWTWGYNGNGQAGLGWSDNAIHATPVQMNTAWSGRWGIRVKAIAAGSRHSLVLTETGSLYGCGSNGYGQLAQSQYGDYFLLTYMRDYVTTMAGGGLHTLVQTDDNQVYGVGYNSYGQWATIPPRTPTPGSMP